MTDGTLAGLIADLEELHAKCPDDECGCTGCRDGVGDYAAWPCSTIGLVWKHKRAQYRILGKGVYRSSGNPDIQLFFGTPAECEAWIELQVNGE